jgi:hypothetical protein
LVPFERERAVVRTGGEGGEQSARIFRRARNAVAGAFQVREQREYACRHIEADGVTRASRCAGIVGQQYGDTARAAWFFAQAHQSGDALGDHLDPIWLGTARERGECELLLRRQRILEGDDAR